MHLQVVVSGVYTHCCILIQHNKRLVLKWNYGINNRNIRYKRKTPTCSAKADKIACQDTLFAVVPANQLGWGPPGRHASTRYTTRVQLCRAQSTWHPSTRHILYATVCTMLWFLCGLCSRSYLTYDTLCSSFINVVWILWNWNRISRLTCPNRFQIDLLVVWASCTVKITIKTYSFDS